MKKITILGLLVLSVMQLGADTAMPRKKFIAHSWDLLWMNPARLLHNIDKLETLPLDGITINLEVTDNTGATRSVLHAFNDVSWQRSWFDKDRATLKRICGGKLKSNFLTSFWVPRKNRVAWDDDAQWEIIANNMAIIAHLAKTSGAKGIMMDTEDYLKKYQYAYQADKDKGTYEETAELARQRGRQVMRAMAEEFPDCVYMSFWFLSLGPLYFDMQGDREAICKAGGMLWVEFINGLLDELPPESIMVDATENGYRHDFRRMDFYKSGHDIKNRAIKLIAPENRAKYRKQMQVGFGLYLDMYTNNPGAEWYFGPLNGSRLEMLRNNFAQAVNIADEYCWVYGELFRWIRWDYQDLVISDEWPKRPLEQLTWDEKLPGVYRAMSLITRPRETVDEWYGKQKAAGKLLNLVQNAACNPNGTGAAIVNAPSYFMNTNLPSGWYFSRNGSRGQFGIDKTTGFGDRYSVFAAGTHGCNFIVKADVQGGKHYVVEAFAKGNSRPKLYITWRAGNKDFAGSQSAYIMFDRDAGNGWLRARGWVTAPEGATEIMVRMDSIIVNEERCNYDMPGVYEFN
jgi:hypothetical protein